MAAQHDQTQVGGQPAQSATPATTTAQQANEVLASSIAAAVERQLTQYVSAMVQQVDASRRASEALQIQLREEFAQQLDDLSARVESQRGSTEAYQRALQSALEERLAEFANHQQFRLDELDRRLATSPRGGMTGEVATVTQGLRDYIENQTGALDARLNELHGRSNRFDEQASALVQHVNDATQTLAKHIEDGDQRVTQEIDRRAESIGGLIDSMRGELESQLVEHRGMLVQRIDVAEMKYTDRMLALEQRVNDTHGTKIATLEATIGRIGAGFDEAMSALSQRSAELTNQLLGVEARIEELSARIDSVDADSLDAMKEKLSAAVGEAMLVRIEVDRVVAATDEKLDKNAMRMAEIEALLNDEMDVGTAVQLERLDELERAVAQLDPNQFVRKVDPTASGLTAPTPSASSSTEGDLGRPLLFSPHLPAAQPATSI